MQDEKKLYKKVLLWFSEGDTGSSSEAMALTLCGIKLDRNNCNWWSPWPHDADDFGRCYRLVQKIPELRLRLNEMESLGPIWKKIAQNWDELCLLFEKPEYTELYKRLQEITATDSKNQVSAGPGVTITVGPVE